MHIKVRLTENIINECLALHYHDQPTGRKMKQRLYLVPLIMLSVAAYILYDEWKQPRLGQNFYMALLYIGFAFIYYFFMRHRMMRAGGKLLKSLGENSSFDVEADEKGLTTTTAQSTFNQPWTAFTGALISCENVLLYQANHSFSMFHHSFFQQNDFDKFKEMVRGNVHPVMEK